MELISFSLSSWVICLLLVIPVEGLSIDRSIIYEIFQLTSLDQYFYLFLKVYAIIGVMAAVPMKPIVATFALFLRGDLIFSGH